MLWWKLVYCCAVLLFLLLAWGWCHGVALFVGLSAGQAPAGLVHPPLLATRPALCTSQIGVQYASRQAWIDFLRDANQMGKLRHPNLGEASSVPAALLCSQRACQ